MNAVARYYARKTRSVIAKYGPGPRVHFHAGFAEAPEPGVHLGRMALQARMHAAQEAVLEESASAWTELSAGLRGLVLDVGCGLGGSALYLADRFGARVVALTDVPEHARIASRFAHATGLGRRVTPVVADAHALSFPAVFDAAVAIESACYLDRARWFGALRAALRPEARVHVVDVFLGEAGAKAAFDAYWHTDVAPFERYAGAARASGFEVEKVERLNPRALGFWDLSIAWSRARLAEPGLGPRERARLEHSIAAHQHFRSCYVTGGIEYLRASFRRA